MISDRLKRVILRQLDLDDFELTADTTAFMVPGWDSLAHLRILAAIEEEYRVRFETGEILRLESLGDLQRLVERKTR